MFEIVDLKKTLEDKISKCDKVIIVPHTSEKNRADFDCIGSAIALSLIAKKYKKPYSIIMNDPEYAMEPGVKKIIEECKGEFEFVNRDKYIKNKGENELFILTDVNKSDLICVSDQLPDKDNIVIIDHHNIGDKTVESNHVFIDIQRSSASEIVTELLQSMKIAIPSNVATYLYSGIFLDTGKLTKPKNKKTLYIVGDLYDLGADTKKVNEYFKESLPSYLKVHDSIKNIKISGCMIALIKTNEDIEYEKEELSKIADEAMKFDVDASFSIGRRSDSTVGISGRSIGTVDIDAIMKNFGGGGTDTSGAADIDNTTIDEVSERLVKVLTPSYYRRKDNNEKK